MAEKKFQCSFWKKYNTKLALTAMIEKTRKIFNKGRTFCTLLTDVSETFNCMTHDLLIAKLHALNVDMIIANSILLMWQKENKESKLIPVLAHTLESRIIGGVGNIGGLDIVIIINNRVRGGWNNRGLGRSWKNSVGGFLVLKC